jgi:hypothetical protein
MVSFKNYWRSIAKESFVKARVLAETVGFFVFVIGGLIVLTFINFPADKIIWWSVFATLTLTLLIEICFIAPYKRAKAVETAHHKELSEQIYEREKAEQHIKELESVGLKGRVCYTAYLKDTNGRDAIALGVQIKNTGEPTIVEGWGMTFELEGTQIALRPTHLREPCNIPYKDKTVKIRSVDLLHEQVGTKPIPKGGSAAGILLFRTKSISYERLAAARPIVTLHFRDVSGREYSAKQEGQGIATPEHIPGLDDPFADILIAQGKEAKAGEQLYYDVVERIDKGSRPIMAVIERGVADELDAEDVIKFCSQLAVDRHGDIFKHLKAMYPPSEWQKFLKDAKRKNLKFPDEQSEVEHMYAVLREHVAKEQRETKQPSSTGDTEISPPEST